MPACPSDPSAFPAGEGAGLRDKLRRLGAAGTHRAPHRASVPPPAGGRDGVELIRARFALTHRHGNAALGEYLEAIRAHDEAWAPAETIWLDTETTGLAGGTGTYVFLVGVASLEGGALVVEQFLLRRLSAESQFLAGLQDRLARSRHLVTFNGQRFDWPILEARFVLSRLRGVSVDVHTDLIHPARRLWHRVLGTHRLGALEAEVLGAPRNGDIPGWEIPALFVHYLRTAERGALEPILAHNRTDLLALIGLHATVARVLRDPRGSHGPLDWEGAGVLLARRGDHLEAAGCFERALQAPLESRDRWRVLRRCVRQYRILGDERRARERWEEAAGRSDERDRYQAQVMAEVARAREACGDRDGAREAAQEALRIADSLATSRAACPAPFVDRLTRRVLRLGDKAPGPVRTPMGKPLPSAG